jgi:glycosyltransferase involved in cell wall biosynthesis
MDGPETVVVVAGLAGSLLNFRGPLLRELVARGCRVVAMAPDDAAVRRRLTELGVEFEAIPLGRTGLNPLADVSLYRHLVARFRILRPTCVLSYTIKPVVYGSLAARRAGVPRIVALVTGRGYAFQGGGLKRRLVGAVAQALYRRALAGVHCTLFQNEDDAELFRDRRLLPAGADVRIVNGSGVDLEHYGWRPLPERVSFLMIARLIADKGVREYVDAARLLRAEFGDNAHCVLVGGLDPNPAGVSADEVRGWVAEGCVDYRGEVADVRPLLEAAAVFVLPSYNEGTPRTVLEAMSTGRAIVTTDAPGCRQTVVDGESGLLVPVRDARSLAAAMARCLSEPGLIARLATAARARAVDRYDVTKVNAAVLRALFP